MNALEGLLGSRWLVDVVLLVVLVEFVVLMLWRRGDGGRALAGIAANLLAGAFLVLALRVALTGGERTWIAACLLAAMVAHVADIGLRLRRG